MIMKSFFNFIKTTKLSRLESKINKAKLKTLNLESKLTASLFTELNRLDQLKNANTLVYNGLVSSIQVIESRLNPVVEVVTITESLIIPSIITPEVVEEVIEGVMVSASVVSIDYLLEPIVESIIVAPAIEPLVVEVIAQVIVKEVVVEVIPEVVEVVKEVVKEVVEVIPGVIETVVETHSISEKDWQFEFDKKHYTKEKGYFNFGKSFHNIENGSEEEFISQVNSYQEKETGFSVRTINMDKHNTDQQWIEWKNKELAKKIKISNELVNIINSTKEANHRQETWVKKIQKHFGFNRNVANYIFDQSVRKDLLRSTNHGNEYTSQAMIFVPAS